MGTVAMITDEQRMPYNRPPLSKELLREEMTEDQLLIEEERWLDEQDIDLVAARAVELDSQAHEVVLSGGRRLRYRQCVLTTGAEPRRLPVPGAFHPGVRVLRSLDDLRELRRRLEPGCPAVVIGSGFIGCEIAASLRILGHPVALISDESAPNIGRLGEEVAAEIAGWLREARVELILGQEVDAIERAGEELRVLAGSAAKAGRVVIMAVGVAPRSELAAMAGAELDGGAVMTDSTLRTSLDDVLAAGDVCAADNASAGRRLRVEHWGDALGQGSVAGRTAAGVEARWDEVPGFWSSIGQRNLKYSAWGDGHDGIRFERVSGGAFRAWYGREGRLVGVLAHQDDDAYERGGELIKAGAAWS
jgi:NADPH-dependent 2,4-dienoyl-CoA reductase/sulfur reductase-like enzyme